MNAFRYLLMISVALLIVGCSDESSSGEQGDCGDRCATWEQCNSRNQCELKSGKCNSNTECQDDAAGKTECAGVDEHTCVAPPECTPEEKRCSGTDLEVCTVDKLWSVLEKCGDSGNICSAETLTCESEVSCTQGAQKCSENAIMTCNSNQWELVANCGGKICDQQGDTAVCVEDTSCVDGTQKCDMNQIMICVDQKWRVKQDCGTSDVCREDENGGFSCVTPPECTFDTQCRNMEYCSEEGFCTPHECQPSGEALCDSLRPVDCGAGQTAIVLGDCWQCVFIDTCAPSCGSVSDCVAYDGLEWIQWTIKTYGHWECSKDNRCKEVPDMELCGDNTCDAALGETEHSCYPDCHTVTPECEHDVDCKDSEYCTEKGICQAHDCKGTGTALCEMLRPDCENGETAIVLGDCWKCVSRSDCRPGCDDVNDCVDYDDAEWITWNIRTMGHWECTNGGNCNEVGDLEMCGNGICDTEKGETGNSCSLDCGPEPTCRVAQDCVDLEDNGALLWPIDSYGHWDCTKSNKCVPISETTTCTDTKCDPENGESSQSCPDDCGVSTEECKADSDCKNSEYCDDKMMCILHECKSFGEGICDTARPDCEDGQTAVMGPVCWVCVSLESCEPICRDDASCVSFDDVGIIKWLINGVGHWACNKSNQCDSVSESTTCGDGKCDADGGESENSCPKDCKKK